MSERITEKSMRSMDHYALNLLKSFRNVDIDTVAVSTRILVAEVRRLRGLILPMWQGTTAEGTLFDDDSGTKLEALVAEAEAIRAEEGK